MKSKLERSKEKLQISQTNLHCTICNEDLLLSDNSLKCENNHTFNINKKGIISFAKPLSDKLYDFDLFYNRNLVLQSNLYDPVYEVLKHKVKDYNTILDAGCGEGSYMNKLKNEKQMFYGLDLAKDGLNIASNYDDATLLLADLANIPLKDQSIDAIINVLSPANYDEFDRILKTDGTLIKVIVNERYLVELREDEGNSEHDNTKVLELLEKHFDIIDREVIEYSKEITEELSKYIQKMTPLTKHTINLKRLDTITIDLTILTCRKRDAL